MPRTDLETTVAMDRRTVNTIQARMDSYAAETRQYLEAFRDLILQPMPLDERVRRYAPPITVPARVSIGKDLRSMANEDLAMLFKNCRAQVAALRVALRAAVVERAQARRDPS